MVEITLSNGKKLEVKKLKFGEFIELQKFTKDNTELTKNLITSSTGMTIEEMNNMEVEDGLEIIKKIIEVNPFFKKVGDFTSSVPSKESG